MWINVEFTLEDLWSDADYSSSFAIRLDTNNIDTGGFILNSILHLLGNWCVQVLFGIFLTPIALGEKDLPLYALRRVSFSLTLLPNTQVKKFIPMPERHILVVMDLASGNPSTSQSVLAVDYFMHSRSCRYFY